MNVVFKSVDFLSRVGSATLREELLFCKRWSLWQTPHLPPLNTCAHTCPASIRCRVSLSAPGGVSGLGHYPRWRVQGLHYVGMDG